MTRSDSPVNLLIADDHRLITDGMVKLLDDVKGIGTIYVAHDGIEAVKTVMQKDIGCVMLDINMPRLNGLDATKQIKRERPGVKVIIVSMLSDASMVTRLLRAGAEGFINKDTGKAELLTALQTVLNGEKYVSPEIQKNLINAIAETGVDTEEKRLTAREIEIVRLIAGGLTNQGIAEKLFLSVATVNTHRKNILAKLHLKNTASLIMYASEHKLL